MGGKFSLDDYATVAERMATFFERHPTGSFQTECQFTQIGERWAAIVKAYAYRTPDDVRPGTGLAYEFIPGATQFTRDSELQNAETASIGRAILSVGAADTKKGIASREEVRNRTAENVVTLDNAEGRHALRVLCEQTSWTPESAASLFEERFEKPPKSAPNDDLLSFVNLVKTGVIQVPE